MGKSKVLWITNILFPEVSAKISSCKELLSSGGWMLGSAEALIASGKVELIVATVSNKVDKLTKIQGKDILYYLIPYGKGNNKVNIEYGRYWKHINQDVNPDIVHIHGTELSHGQAYVKACGSKNVVVSIQGLMSACAENYHLGISEYEIYKNLTIRDVFRGSMIKARERFRKSAEYELDLLKSVNHIIGRTSWDRIQTSYMNPEANYYHCNETLRKDFYDGSLWAYEQCEKHSIFISQATYPLKGFHQLIKAFPMILKSYPNAKIRVAGTDITRLASIKDFIHYTGYGRYIKGLIKKYDLQAKITFLGNLNAEGMKKEYLRCNVFVCPSSIENSPNSLGEAQILGVPCVASCVGGVPDIMRGNEENLYSYEDISKLAENVINVFDNRDKQKDMVHLAILRHDSVQNSSDLENIYQLIISKNI